MVHPQLTLMAFPSNIQDKILGHIGGSIFQNQKTGGLFGIIPYFAIETEFRNQGIGSALLKALIDLYQMNNATCIVLNCDLQNPGIRLFERFGFRCELGKVQSYANGKRALQFIMYFDKKSPDAKAIQKWNLLMYCPNTSCKKRFMGNEMMCMGCYQPRNRERDMRFD